MLQGLKPLGALQGYLVLLVCPIDQAGEESAIIETLESAGLCKEPFTWFVYYDDEVRGCFEIST